MTRLCRETENDLSGSANVAVTVTRCPAATGWIVERTVPVTRKLVPDFASEMDELFVRYTVDAPNGEAGGW